MGIMSKIKTKDIVESESKTEEALTANNSDDGDDTSSVESIQKPKFPTAFGYFTEHGMKLWIAAHPKEYKQNKSVVKTLEYHEDESKPWFREAFSELDTLEHHIQTQVGFWMDAFGAGKKYHGSAYRLNFHHKHNAAAVMNEKGAHLWMEYMKNTLDSKEIVLTNDKRVRPAINGFLKLMMNKYGHDF